MGSLEHSILQRKVYRMTETTMSLPKISTRAVQQLYALLSPASSKQSCLLPLTYQGSCRCSRPTAPVLGHRHVKHNESRMHDNAIMPHITKPAMSSVAPRSVTEQSHCLRYLVVAVKGRDRLRAVV